MVRQFRAVNFLYHKLRSLASRGRPGSEKVGSDLVARGLNFPALIVILASSAVVVATGSVREVPRT